MANQSSSSPLILLILTNQSILKLLNIKRILGITCPLIQKTKITIQLHQALSFLFILLQLSALDDETKPYLLKVPLVGFGANNLPLTGAEIIMFIAGVMNFQSAGYSTLICQPSDPSVIDLNFCSHPDDK